jgi:hypothetical protein
MVERNKCHMCHEWMDTKDLYGQQNYPIGEWHICDECMEEEYQRNNGE